jgi:hypothetical protein
VGLEPAGVVPSLPEVAQAAMLITMMTASTSARIFFIANFLPFFKYFLFQLHVCSQNHFLLWAQYPHSIFV